MNTQRPFVLLFTLAACGSPAPTPAPAPGPIAFSDVTADVGLTPAASPCLIFRDLDRDGRPDLLLAPVNDQGLFGGVLKLYKNPGAAGPWTATDIAVAGFDLVRSCATADLDNDGWTDLVLAGIKGPAGAFAILRSDGTTGHAFTDVTGPAAATFSGLMNVYPESIGLMDMDNDGWPDIVAGFIGEFGGGWDCGATADDFACHPLTPHMSRAPLILHNNAGKGFSTAPMQPAEAAYVNVVAFLDYDGDGWADLYEAVDLGSNLFQRNLAGKGFSDWMAPWHANPFNHGMGAAFADFDHDGLWDFYAVDEGPDQLYFGKPDGSVENRAAALGIVNATRFHSGWSPLAADFNNDGDVDIFVPNAAVASTNDELINVFTASPGTKTTDAPQAAYVFANSKGRRFDFTQVPYKQRLVPNSITAAAAYADYDGDGRLDVAEVIQARTFVVRLLHNDSPTQGAHWLDVHLSGAMLNGGGLGATLLLKDGDKEIDRRYVGSGNRGISTEVAHFGLGARATVSSLEVRWPDGTKQTVPGPIAADKVLEVKHP